MRPLALVRYLHEIGWHDPPSLPTRPTSESATASSGGPDGCDDLPALAALAAGCTACRLSEARRTVVFGEGDPAAAVMFVGEGPGGEEDRTGRPFVGQAGRLLDGMIRAMGLERDEVYIANVVKCRPPGNRDPQEDEMTACAPFLERQIELIRPRVIVALGRIAARRLTGSSRAMGALRGRWTSYRGTPLTATYHPAYLLRNPADKRRVWEDLKGVMAKLRDGE